MLCGPHQRVTPQARWRPLCNDEWSVLAGYLDRLDLPGRPVNDPRNRLNAKRLGFLSALRGPPWCLPDPSLSVRVTRQPIRRFAAAEPATPITTQPWFRSATRLIRAARGRRIPRAAPWP
jgi:hypothetical protein